MSLSHPSNIRRARSAITASRPEKRVGHRPLPTFGPAPSLGVGPLFVSARFGYIGG